MCCSLKIKGEHDNRGQAVKTAVQSLFISLNYATTFVLNKAAIHYLQNECRYRYKTVYPTTYIFFPESYWCLQV